MILLFVLTASAVLVGGICLWLSGWLFGSRFGGANDSSASEQQALMEEKRLLQDELQRVRNELSFVRQTSGGSEETTTISDGEVARLAVQNDQLVQEKNAASEEIQKLRDELHTLRQRNRDNLPKLPTPSRPSAIPPIETESEALDTLQAELDLERVAHQKTKEELAQVKKIAAIKMGSQPTSFGTSGRSGFKTLAISTRPSDGAEGGESSMARTLAQVQEEKDRIESELARAKQELQLLKMRQ